MSKTTDAEKAACPYTASEDNLSSDQTLCVEKPGQIEEVPQSLRLLPKSPMMTLKMFALYVYAATV